MHFAVIATRPSAQRQGLGGQLLQAATKVADKHGKWSWVEATSPGSRNLYARHGFETVHESVLQPGCPVLYFMQRAPVVVS
ncbi:TPA: hypothetical protein ACH3X3_008506 [Trebouxia sp. C0006]